MTYTLVFRSKINCFFVVVLLLIQLEGYSQDSTHTDTAKKGIVVKNENPLKKNEERNTPSKPIEIPDSADQKKTDSTKVFVTKVYNSRKKDISDTLNELAGIGDIIVIKVDNLAGLISTKKDQKLKLFINGREIEKIEPLSGAPDLDNETVQFRLDRNTSNNKTWADILGSPPLGPNFFTTPVKVSIGFDNGVAIKTHSNKEYNFELVRIHKGWFWACLIILIIYLFVLVTMAKSEGLLRDRTIDLSTIGIDIKNHLPGYSLGRFQMAFWFTLTLMSFFFIWLITDAYDIITATVLSLIGISAATSLSGAVIDDSKSRDILNQTITLQTELANLKSAIADLNKRTSNAPPPPDLGSLQASLKTAQERELQIPPLIANNTKILTPRPSKGFLNDILRDANGISFHRLQMFVWTLVLGVIFIYTVWKDLSMPDFGATLLALQGLTSATYLGFKFPEKQA